MNRVVVTGMGVISPNGCELNTFWNSVVEGKNNFTEMPFDTGCPVKLASQMQDFDPVAFDISKKEARRMDLYCQYAMAAANKALADAGDLKIDNPFRAGVIVSSGIGGFHTIMEEHEKFLEKGPSRTSVFFVPMMISNMAAGQISIAHGLKGTNFCIVTACASSAHSVGEAYRAIKHGYQDVMVAGGSEASVIPLAVAGFHNMGALAEGEDPNRVSIPFDKERNGFVMGEGAAVLVLEEYERAVKRGAKIYGEIVGYGATGDAYHITSPDPDGLGSSMAMKFAIEEAGIEPGQVDYINAHGTSTPVNDKFETKAIKMALGEEAAKKVAISSTKAVTGHLLGAAGSIEAIASLMALKEGVIPMTANFKVPDEECDLDYVTEGSRKQEITYALSNSLGFGGHNASLLFKKYNG